MDVKSYISREVIISLSQVNFLMRIACVSAICLVEPQTFHRQGPLVTVTVFLGTLATWLFTAGSPEVAFWLSDCSEHLLAQFIPVKVS